MRSRADKIEFLYALTERMNEVAVVADRRGCGEVGQLILEVVDYAASKIGLPPDYKKHADEWRLVNGGLEELLEEYPEGDDRRRVDT